MNTINEVVVTSNKLTNNFAGLVTRVIRPGTVLRPSVLPRCHDGSHEVAENSLETPSICRASNVYSAE